MLFSASLKGSAGEQESSHLAVTSCCRLCLLILLLEVGSCSLRRRMVVVAAQGGPTSLDNTLAQVLPCCWVAPCSIAEPLQLFAN